jgi:hypothetical protein
VTTTIQLPNLTGVWRKCLTAADVAYISDSPFLQKPNFKVIVQYSLEDPSYDIYVEQYDEVLSIMPTKSCIKRPDLAKTGSRQVNFCQTTQVVEFDKDDEPATIKVSPNQFDSLLTDDLQQDTSVDLIGDGDPHPSPTIGAYNLKGALLNPEELKKVIYWGEPKAMNTVDPISGNLTREWRNQHLLDRRKHLQTFTIPAITAKPTPKPKSPKKLKEWKEDSMCMLYYAIKWSNMEYALFQRVMLIMQCRDVK